MAAVIRSFVCATLAASALHSFAQFNPGQFIFPGSDAELRSVDLDADGDLDLFGVFDGDHLKWFSNTDGQGTFGTMQMIADIEGQCTLVELADMDNDLDMDVLFVSSSSDAVRILRNDGGGAFTLDGELDLDTEPRALRAADLNGDGFNDVIVTLDLDDTAGLGFFLGSATGFSAFTPIPYTQSGPASNTLEVGDMDLLGGLDLLLTAADDAVVLLRNVTGDATDWQAEEIVVVSGELSYPYRHPLLMDVDGDGDLDLAESRGPAVHWLRNLLDEGGLVTFEENVVEPWKSSGDGAFGRSICSPGACLVYVPNNPGLPVRWNSYLPALGDFPYSNDLPALPRGRHPLLADFNADGRDDLVMEVDGGLFWFVNEVTSGGTLLELPVLDTLCRAGAPVAMPSATPAGGQWYGQQISNGLFYRSNLPGTVDVPVVHAVYPDNGCPLGGSATLHVIQGPVITTSIPPVLCSADTPIQLLSVPASVEWFGLDGSDIIDPAVWNGGYIVCEYTDATGAFCSDVEGPIQRWNTLPAQLAEVDTLCTTDTPVAIEVIAAPPLNVVWEGPVSEPSATGALFDPSIGPGTYVVVLNAEAFAPNQCRNSDTIHVVVDEAPTIGFDGIPVYCASGEPIELSGAYPLGGTWSGDGVNDGLVDPVVLGAGVHLLNYFASSVAGCGAQASTSITLADATQVVWEAQDLLLCPGEEAIQFAATPLGGSWSEPVNLAGVFVADDVAPGTYPIVYSYVDPRGCALDNEPIDVVIGTPKVVTIAEVGTVCLNAVPFQLAGSAPGVWSGSLSGEGSTLPVDPAALGVGTWPITLLVSPENECAGSATLNLVIEVCTDVNEITDVVLRAAPHPFNEHTQVNFGTFAAERIDVFDAAGRCVHSVVFGAPPAYMDLDLGTMADGTYLLRAQGRQGITQLRLVKAR